MDMTLLRQSAMSGESHSVIFLLHGYGANADDLMGLARPLAIPFPDCEFVAPNAPESCPGLPNGRRWFPIPWMDGADEAAVESSLQASTEILAQMVESELQRLNLREESAILFGFSQGTMIALHYAARHARRFAGVIGFSGRLLAPERLQSETVSRPPVLLVHGDADPVVPFACLREAEAALEAAEFSVRTHVSSGTAHSIAPDGLEQAVLFARTLL